MSIPIVLSEKLYSNIFFRWLTYLRPLSEFRIGGFSIREILNFHGYDIYFDSIDNLYGDFVTKKYRIRSYRDLKNKDFILLNIGVTGSISSINKALDELITYSQERVIAYYLGDKLFGIYMPSGIGGVEDIDISNVKKVQGSVRDIFVIDYPWEIPDYNHYLIRKNKSYLLRKLGFDEYSKGIYIKGDIYISRHTYFDTRDGPIFVYDAKEIDGFAVIRGPTIVREGSYINGGKISNSVIGPVCKIGGEVSDSLVNGYSNMQHHSYVGHSYVGEWVNIGAGTVFSDLKNTYGPIRIYWNERRYDTGIIKIGSFVGDHVKFSINSSVFSGKIIGLFSHAYGLVSENIPPFTIWDGYNNNAYVLNLEKALEIGVRVYGRRGVKMSKIEKKWLSKVFKLTDKYRMEYGVKEGVLKF